MNWGKGLTIVIVVFLFAILMMVFTVSNRKIDLVTEDYYPKEIVYQQEIEKQQNYLELSQKPIIVTKDNTFELTFPDGLTEELKGQVHFYRPSDKFLDRKYDLQLNENREFVIDLSDFKPGKYEVILTWESKGKPYYVKQVLII